MSSKPLGGGKELYERSGVKVKKGRKMKMSERFKSSSIAKQKINESKSNVDIWLCLVRAEEASADCSLGLRNHLKRDKSHEPSQDQKLKKRVVNKKGESDAKFEELGREEGCTW